MGLFHDHFTQSQVRCFSRSYFFSLLWFHYRIFAPNTRNCNIYQKRRSYIRTFLVVLLLQSQREIKNSSCFYCFVLCFFSIVRWNALHRNGVAEIPLIYLLQFNVASRCVFFVPQYEKSLPTISDVMRKDRVSWMILAIVSSVTRVLIIQWVAELFHAQHWPPPISQQVARKMMHAFAATTTACQALAVIVFYDNENFPREHFGAVGMYIISTTAARWLSFQAFDLSFPHRVRFPCKFS